MAKEVRLNVRLPEYLKEKLTEEAQKKNITLSDLVRFILVERYSNKT